MLRVTGEALRSPLSVAAGLLAGLAVFLLIVWLPNLGLIWSVVSSSSMSLSGKAAFLWDSLGVLDTGFTTLGAALSVAVAVLFSLNVAVAAHFVRRQAAETRAGGASMAGVAVALVGAGCSSCGAVLLSTLIGAGATSSFITELPLHGDEVSLLSVIILAVSVVVITRKASQAGSCRIEPSPRTMTLPSSHS